MTDPTPRLHRRGFVRSAVAGSLLMPGILHELLAAEGAADPLAPRAPHFPAKAKSVIFLFMSGGVSHVDSFDPKPRLAADHGKAVTLDHPETRSRPGYESLFLKRPGWAAAPRGQSGIEVTDLFPCIGEQVDDLALIRSMHTSHSNHYNATLGMHTGSFAFARPSLGSWLSYGLGTSNRDLPSFLVLAPADALRGDPGLGGRLPAGGPPGDPGRARGRADRRPRPPGADRGAAGAGAGGPAGVQRRAPGGAVRTIPTWPRASGRSRRPSGCRPRSPRRSTSPPSRTPRSPSTAWSAAGPTASAGSAWPPAGWSSAGSGSSS